MGLQLICGIQDDNKMQLITTSKTHQRTNASGVDGAYRAHLSVRINLREIEISF